MWAQNFFSDQFGIPPIWDHAGRFSLGERCNAILFAKLQKCFVDHRNQPDFSV